MELVYEMILKVVKVHKGDKLLQPELIARNTGSIIKGQCALSSHRQVKKFTITVILERMLGKK